MPQHLEWLIDERVLYSRLTGELTMEELHTNSTNALQMSATVTHKLLIHTILDGRTITKIPSVPEMLGHKHKRGPNTGWAVMILSPNRIYKFLASATNQILGVHFKLVDTWGEAVTFLAIVDDTLANIVDLPEKTQET